MKQILFFISFLGLITASTGYSLPTIIINNDFKKNIDTAKLEKILILNDPKAIVRIIQNDVDLYKINFKTENTQTTQIQKLIRELPESRINMKSILNGIEIESVLGLFLPFEQLQNTNSRDALFIREDAGVWTLVHEYMHFLFNIENRKNNPLDPPRLQNLIKDNTETYNEEISKYRLTSSFENESRQNDLAPKKWSRFYAAASCLNSYSSGVI